MKENKIDASGARFSRRKLIGGVLSTGAASVAGISGITRAADKQSTKLETLKKGAVIVFQGDSITDGGRKREKLEANDTGGLGNSYAAILAGLLHADYPEHDLRVYNRGISGNKVPDLAARWKEDVIDLKPDLLSIMVGVNDYWHTIAFGSKYKGTTEDYEKGFRELIIRSQKEIPGVRIVICDPFTFRDWPNYAPYQKIAKKLAHEFKLNYVPFQDAFDKLGAGLPKSFWLWDGVHPTMPGYAQMAQVWREAIGI